MHAAWFFGEATWHYEGYKMFLEVIFLMTKIIYFNFNSLLFYAPSCLQCYLRRGGVELFILVQEKKLRKIFLGLVFFSEGDFSWECGGTLPQNS